jgi:uridine phosphorylase
MTPHARGERIGAVTSYAKTSHPTTHSQPIHLRPTAPLAERVLLPGDPGRALALAQLLIEKPLMFNHHRGLWGYTGAALADGEPLSVQSTGMGGPSAAIVLHELIALGARRAIRVGTCGALAATGIRAKGECPSASAGGLELGDLVVAREALAADGTSRALGTGERIAADRELSAALADAVAGATGSNAHDPVTVVSTDLFYEHDDTREREWCAAGAVAVEMEAAALFAVGARAGIRVACVLAVSDLLADGAADGRERIDDGALLLAAEAMGRAAVSSLV